MLFNSLDFAIFLPIVFALYWFVVDKSIKWQNLLIVVASYVFYGWWDWRFLSLIIFSTLLDFTIGHRISKEESTDRRKLLLWVSILANLGILGFFKYYNFFLDNFIEAFSLFGTDIKANSLDIILPVGISFYTFQTLSYTIDIYRRKLQPTTDIIAFSAFVSFFPQLVAGPIERATNLLPQFSKTRTFDQAAAVIGLRQILWGLFKKIVIADNCAIYANLIFDNSNDFSGSALILGALFFTFQIYGDFSGYSDIAIGTSRLFGFNLMKNFNFPYFSRDIAEFWRRWHISLSTWFRDYLYIPLGGSRGSIWNKIRNTFIIFLISGFWHGANWKFIVWGALHATFFLPLLITNQNRKNLGVVAEGRRLPSLREISSISLTFTLTVFAWIFFRADSITHAFSYIENIFSSNFTLTVNEFTDIRAMYLTLVFIAGFMVIEWLAREQEFAISKLVSNRILRLAIYYFIVFSIIYFGNFGTNEFIYFQF